MEENPQTTQFNMSIATLQRIHDTLIALNHNNINANPINIKRLLLVLYKETNAFLETKERKSAKEQWKVIRSNINISNNNSINYQKGIHLKMNDFEFWLRDKLKEKGILMAQSEDPRFALQ